VLLPISMSKRHADASVYVRHTDASVF